MKSVSFVRILNIPYYLGDEARTERFRLPSHKWGGTSCHMTLKSQVASFLNVVVRGKDSDLRQT